MPQPVLLIHGGAWAMPDDAVPAHKEGIRLALQAGWSVLAGGGSSLDGVEAAITVMESHEAFDAGRGSFLTRDGRVQMDALLMTGHDLRAGGVACVERLEHPIQAARLVLERSPHVYFVGEGAEAFAAGHGMPLIRNADLVIARESARLARFHQEQAAGVPDSTFAGRGAGDVSSPTAATRTGVTPTTTELNQQGDATLAEVALQAEVDQALPAELRFDDPTLTSHDTVGAVALDTEGRLAAGTSTGGTLGKSPGRVGDSSLIGCGCYADNESAAVSLTGWGEPIMKLVLGKWAADRVAAGANPQTAAADAIGYLHRRLGGHGGIILLGPDGRMGLAHNTPRMAWGYADTAGQRMGMDYAE